MDIRRRHGLKMAAAAALSEAPDHKKLVLLWAGIGTALPLLASVLNFILEFQIADTGGLSGIGLRSVLSTIQSLLSMSTTVLIPFWTLGYIGVTLRFARREAAGYPCLLDGFRRFGPALRLILLELAIYAIICFICVQVGSTVLSFTPLAEPVYQVLEDSQQMLLSGVIDESVLLAMTEAMIPILAICSILCVVVLIPVMYRLRLTRLIIMDTPRCGALFAVRESLRLMGKNCMHLLRLDLSFWWYYLAQILLGVLCYGDVILPMLGISLPFSQNAAFFIFYIVALLAQLALLYYFSARVQTTYALFYNTLRIPTKEQNSLII